MGSTRIIIAMGARLDFPDERYSVEYEAVWMAAAHLFMRRIHDGVINIKGLRLQSSLHFPPRGSSTHSGTALMRIIIRLRL